MELKCWWTATLLLRSSLSTTRQFHQGTLYVIPNYSFKPLSMLCFCPQPKCVRYFETIMSMQTRLTCKYCNSYSGLWNGWINMYLITAVTVFGFQHLLCFHFIADIFPKTSCPMLQCTLMHSEIWPAWLYCKMMENIGFDICSVKSLATQLMIFAMHSNIYWPVG